VSLGGGAVDTLNSRGVECDEARQDRLPDPRLRPSVEAVVDRRVRAVFGRAILPAAANVQHVDDPADHLAIPLRFHAGPIHRYPRLQNRPLLIGQPEKVRHRFAPITWECRIEPTGVRSTGN